MLFKPACVSYGMAAGGEPAIVAPSGQLHP